MTSAVAASAGKKDSIASSDKVILSGAPNTVVVLAELEYFGLRQTLAVAH